MLIITLYIAYFPLVFCIDNIDDFLIWSQKALFPKWTTSYILSDLPQNNLQNVTQLSSGLFSMQSNFNQSSFVFGDVIFIEATSNVPIIDLSQKDFIIINGSHPQHLDKSPLLIADGDLIYRWTKHAINLLQQYQEISILPVITDDKHHYETSCDGYPIFILDPRCSVQYVDNQNVNVDLQTTKCLPYSVENIPYKSKILPYAAKTPLYFNNKAVDGFYIRECTQKWVLCGKYIRIRPRIIMFVKRKTIQQNNLIIPPLSTFNYFCSCSQPFIDCQTRHSDTTLDISSLHNDPIFITINERRACYTFKDCYYFKFVSNMYKEITDIFNLNIIKPIPPINVTYFDSLISSNVTQQWIHYQSHIVKKFKSIQHIIIGMTVLVIVFGTFILFVLTAK